MKTPNQPREAGEAAQIQTPFRVSAYHDSEEDCFMIMGADGSCIARTSYAADNNERDAAFIVRACNSHAALVEALEATVNQLVFTLTESNSGDAWRGITQERAQSIKTTLDVARAALASATS